MIRRFFTNEFEQSLKENADKFQMVPSKKVWHGIYNDLHPGKRWPSVTMSLLLIFTLVGIGHLNTNNSRKLALTKFSNTQKLTGNLKKTGSSTNTRKIIVRKADIDKSREAFVYSTGESKSTGSLARAAVSNYQNNNAKEDQHLTDNLNPDSNAGSSNTGTNFILNPHLSTNSGTINTAGDVYQEEVFNNDARLPNISSLDVIMKEPPQGKLIANHPDNSLLSSGTLQEKKSKSKTEELPATKNIDDIVSATKTPAAEDKVTKLPKKRNDKKSWVYFAAPVVSSVSFSGEPLKEALSANFSPGLSLNQKENKVLHNAVLGFEAGAQMNYSLSKKIQFTTGIHLTYSGYDIISNIVHPIPAVLVLRNPSTGATYSQSFMTHYGDGTGQALVTLRNYSWQASIPFGLQYEVLRNNKLRFDVGANLEPSLSLKSDAYILSSDGNNYINDPALLRKWNLSSNFGAFVTFRSIKFKWQIGPNIRRQWMSTYLKDYTVKEHLIDYGIRIGISK